MSFIVQGHELHARISLTSCVSVEGVGGCSLPAEIQSPVLQFSFVLCLWIIISMLNIFQLSYLNLSLSSPSTIMVSGLHFTRLFTDISAMGHLQVNIGKQSCEVQSREHDSGRRRKG